MNANDLKGAWRKKSTKDTHIYYDLKCIWEEVENSSKTNAISLATALSRLQDEQTGQEKLSLRQITRKVMAKRPNSKVNKGK